MTLTVEELRQYVRCPLEWFWERRAGVPRPRTVIGLVADSLRPALAFLYQGYASSLPDAARLVWQDWCEGWGEATLMKELDRYAQGRAAILNLFERGRVTRSDGRRYWAPQLTNEYRNRMHSAGLTDLGRRLDDLARAHSLLPEGEAGEVGGALGDAFADALTAAGRVGPQLPAREVSLGCLVPYEIGLPNSWRLAGTADLVWRSEAGKGAVVMEVHDYQEPAWTRAGLAGRDLRVIAASLAQPPAGAPGNVTWERVDRVVYRHWPMGQAFTFHETSVGHLLAVMSAVARGMEAGVVIPRALAGYEECRACPHRERCWGEHGWEAMPQVDASALERARQLRDLTGRLREAVNGDDRAAQRVRDALDVLAEGLQRLPDSLGAAALLAESRHVLEAEPHG